MVNWPDSKSDGLPGYAPQLTNPSLRERERYMWELYGDAGVPVEGSIGLLTRKVPHPYEGQFL